MTPQAIHRALSEGVMRHQGAALTALERRQVSEYLAFRQMPASGGSPLPATCRVATPAPPARTLLPFSGWG